MTMFEDRLLGQLVAEHGDRLRAPERPAPARRRVRRPVWLAVGAAGAAAAATAAVMTLGSAPAYAAYSVTRHDGTLSVSVSRLSGVAGANAALHALRARVVSCRCGQAARRSGRCRAPAGPTPGGVGRQRGERARAALSYGQDQGRHPQGRHDGPGVQPWPRPRFAGGGGHNHWARAPLCEPPGRAVTRWRRPTPSPSPSSALPAPGPGEDYAGKGCREGLASGDVMSRPLLTRSPRSPVSASACGPAGGRRYQRRAGS